MWQQLSEILMYIGAGLALVAVAIKPWGRLEVTKLSKWNFIIPTLGVICIAIAGLIQVFIEHG